MVAVLRSGLVVRAPAARARRRPGPTKRLLERHLAVDPREPGLVRQQVRHRDVGLAALPRTRASSARPARRRRARLLARACWRRSRSRPSWWRRRARACPRPTAGRSSASAMPPHRSTTFSPRWYALNDAPISRPFAKFASNASRTPSNPSAVVPLLSVMGEVYQTRRAALPSPRPAGRSTRCKSARSSNVTEGSKSSTSSVTSSGRSTPVAARSAEPYGTAAPSTDATSAAQPHAAAALRECARLAAIVQHVHLREAWRARCGGGDVFEGRRRSHRHDHDGSRVRGRPCRRPFAVGAHERVHRGGRDEDRRRDGDAEHRCGGGHVPDVAQHVRPQSQLVPRGDIGATRRGRRGSAVEVGARAAP